MSTYFNFNCCVTQIILQRPITNHNNQTIKYVIYVWQNNVPTYAIFSFSDEVVTGGPVTLNPIPLRKGPIRPTRRDLEIDPGKMSQILRS
jgi:hypothetical protein